MAKSYLSIKKIIFLVEIEHSYMYIKRERGRERNLCIRKQTKVTGVIKHVNNLKQQYLWLTIL